MSFSTVRWYNSSISVLNYLPTLLYVCSAGDFSNYGSIQEVNEFREWVETLPYEHKIIIAGNHDVSFDAERIGAELQGEESPTEMIAAFRKSFTYLQVRLVLQFFFIESECGLTTSIECATRPRMSQ
jgi:predicted phosphohydrolase